MHAKRCFTTVTQQKLRTSARILDLNEGATYVDCKRAYFLKAKQCHPDITKKPSFDFVKLHEAYETVQTYFNETGHPSIKLS